MLTKTLKILYLIIGVMILFMMGRAIVTEFLEDPEEEYSYAEDIMVGTSLEESLLKGKVPQGLLYESPNEIPNSDYKMLPLSVLTYQQEKDLKDMAARSGDISLSMANYVNILFLDKNYKVEHQLLDSLASVSDMELPYPYGNKQDSTIQNILYMIGFQDTNEDNLLNSQDDSDLYISDLNGRNLKKITSGFNVKSYWFKESHSKIFIEYTLRTKEREEHKRKMFAIYDIQEQQLRTLDEVTERINAIEANIIKQPL